jgi:hypothetical protein
MRVKITKHCPSHLTDPRTIFTVITAVDTLRNLRTVVKLSLSTTGYKVILFSNYRGVKSRLPRFSQSST